MQASPSDVESLASSLADLSSHSTSPHLPPNPQFLHDDSSPQHHSGRPQDVLSLPADQEKTLPPEDAAVRGDGSKSRASVKSQGASVSSKSAYKVAISERRGLFSTVCVMPEYFDPRAYAKSSKLTIVAIVAFAAVAGPMGTSILLPAVEDLASDLDTTVTEVNVSVGIYLLSMGIFPMWWSNFSEKHGRRSVYVLSFSWYFAFSIGCALAPSISALIVLRLLAGVGASAVQACGAGTISDLYIQEERGSALGLFYLGPLLGPFISPIIGGAVAEAWGWRSTMWVMVIVCGLNLVSIVFLLPETLPRESPDALREKIHETFDKDEEISEANLERMVSNLSQSSSLRLQVLDEETPVDVVMPSLSRLTTNHSAYSKKVRDYELDKAETGATKQLPSFRSQLYNYIIRPMHAMYLLAYPPVILVISYSSVGFMGIYFFNITISNAYSESPYNFSSVIVGLMYIPNSITYVIASIYGGRWNDWLIRRSARRYNGELRPESRLSWNVVLAASLYPPACMIFGWCLDKKQHWVTPLIGSALFGFASMLIIGTTVTYLIDILPGKGATGVALNNLVRQILAAVATFITEPLTSAIGTGVLFCIYLGVVCIAATTVYYLKKRGAGLRAKYDITKYYAKL